MALSRVELNVHPYGLGGGIVLSGSVSAGPFTDVFQYYPLTNTTATIKMNMLYSGSATSNSTASFILTSSAGVPVYGPITAVTQSSGIGVVYRGVVTADGGYRL
jgi:hypothetical protein